MGVGGLFCHTLVGGWLLFVFHMFPLHKLESFRLVSTVWTVPEGLGAEKPPAPRPRGTHLVRAQPRREEGLVQERRRLSGCWVTAILCTVSHLGRTESLRGPPPGPPGQTGANTTSLLAMPQGPRRWRTPDQELTWSFRGAVPPGREKRENKVPVNFGSFDH